MVLPPTMGQKERMIKGKAIHYRKNDPRDKEAADEERRRYGKSRDVVGTSASRAGPKKDKS